MKRAWQFCKDVSADFFSEIWTFVGLFSAFAVGLREGAGEERNAILAN